MLRLVACLQIAIGSAWIAGYLAIVLPVITGRMQPGTQNGNFTMWADVGYFFLLMLAPCLLYWAWHFWRQSKILRSVITLVLIALIALFQIWTHQNTYEVDEASQLRNQQHENTKLYQKHNARLQKAHKASERIVGFLLILLIVEISLSSVAIQCRMDQTES